MIRKILTGGLAAVALGAAFAAPAPAQAFAILDNGTIQIGVNDLGHLNVPYPDDPLPDPIGVMGLRYKPTGAASTEPGCQCEGWGVSNGSVSGFANNSVGTGGLSLDSFSSTATTAISTVTAAGGIFRVTHNYNPSASANLYQVDVTIENISGSDQTALYRRVMDWDIYPTPFSELVTIVDSSPIVFRTSNNGFASANPLVVPGGTSGPFTDLGPADHGALFDFDFGSLAAGASKSFTTFYGAGANMAEVLAALGEVGSENVYSLGKCNPSNPACTIPGGAPNTFVFAFKGVGGTVIPDPTPGDVPEPATLTLLGAGLAGLGALRRRRKAA